MAASMTPERVRELLAELAARVAATSDEGTAIRVVGGAAISLLDPARRATSDIDAVVSGPGEVDDVVATMAAEHGLPADWFNSAVAMWIPFVGPEDWVEVLRNDNVSVHIGSTSMLLAMKLREESTGQRRHRLSSDRVRRPHRGAGAGNLRALPPPGDPEPRRTGPRGALAREHRGLTSAVLRSRNVAPPLAAEAIA